MRYRKIGFLFRAWLRQWGPAVIIMGIIFLASSTPGGNLPDFGAWDVDVKKGGHILGYALLGAAYLHGLTKGKSATRLQWVLAICLAVIYSISDEFHQSFIPERSPSLGDLLIDTIGAASGLGIWTFIRMRFLDLHKATNV